MCAREGDELGGGGPHMSSHTTGNGMVRGVGDMAIRGDGVMRARSSGGVNRA